MEGGRPPVKGNLSEVDNDDLGKCGEVEDHGEAKWVEEKENEEMRRRSRVMRKGK